MLRLLQLTFWHWVFLTAPFGIKGVARDSQLAQLIKVPLSKMPNIKWAWNEATTKLPSEHVFCRRFIEVLCVFFATPHFHYSLTTQHDIFYANCVLSFALQSVIFSANSGWCWCPLCRKIPMWYERCKTGMSNVYAKIEFSEFSSVAQMWAIHDWRSNFQGWASAGAAFQNLQERKHERFAQIFMKPKIVKNQAQLSKNSLNCQLELN